MSCMCGPWLHCLNVGQPGRECLPSIYYSMVLPPPFLTPLVVGLRELSRQPSLQQQQQQQGERGAQFEGA